MVGEGVTDIDTSVEERLFSMEQCLKEQAEEHRKQMEKHFFFFFYCVAIVGERGYSGRPR